MAVALFLLLFLLPGLAQADDQTPPRFSAENSHALASAKEVILYSLDPVPPEPQQVKSGEMETFHGWRVLGKAKLTGRHASIATSAFDAALNPEEKKSHDSDYEQEFAQCLLEPRHALTFQSEGHIYDFVLCYECGQMVMYRDGKETEYNADHGSPQALDNILTEAHIPLPPPAAKK
ncbi:MAG: hypothetical protein EPN97_04150 [Alphaproteobacteria bacterium]|nr:MAG: hypothetical protein EPN97_04150 [Alphaproteobacteria bacterium]